MTLPVPPARSTTKSDRLVAFAVWTFAIVEAVGIAFLLWRF
ncbi:MAG: hypothetical protein WD801_16915 [Gemmatimonadaceae bacterium]